jgi:hypothetical protein
VRGLRIVLAALLVATGAACGPRATQADPCAPAGCTVPGTGPLYVPLCHRGDEGPCVGQASGAWRYVHRGATWPGGTRVAPCASASGAPVPCVWVPSVMGGDQGDSGAYVYGVAGEGFPLPREVEPS